jgi:hypothetical protein|tara:strand:- start:41 stop:274 length:234 start_codon:yes stop_codon:yes gene_type:complete
MFSLLIVCFVLNYDPALPPEGSGLFGFVLAEDFLKDEPAPLAADDFAAINFLLLAFLSSFRFDCVYFGINKIQFLIL